MGYLFLSLALAAGLTKGFCGKKISGATKTLADASLINLLRMAFCVAIGAALMLAGGVIHFANFDAPTILAAAFSWVFTSAFVVTWLISVRTGAYVMLDVFLMLGVSVTVSCCRIFFGEEIRPNQIIGFVILVVAAYIMCSYNISLNGRMTVGKLALLLLCGAANGFVDFSQKLFVYHAPNGNVAEFNFYTYLFSALVLLFVFVFLKLREPSDEAREPFSMKRAIPYVSVMAVCLFLNSYFKTLAAARLDSAVLYPLNQGLALMLSMVMAAVFFKERITARCVIGLCLAFGGLLIINLL